MAEQTTTPLLPPDEKFWQRYSPHHEFPVSGVASLFLHGLILGLLVTVGVLVNLRWHGDAGKPPNMDVVTLDPGDGSEGLGGPEGFPGAGDGTPTELTPNQTPSLVPRVDGPSAQLENAPAVELALPSFDTKPEPKDLLSELDRLTKEASVPNPMTSKGPPGTNNPKGVGGKGGIGDGPGPGRGKKGVGAGAGGGGGLSKSQIFARRWHFDLSGGPKDHADKLVVVGIMLAVMDARGETWFIRDLMRRPAEIYKADMNKFKDAVLWENTNAKSIFGLARELNLPFVPQKLIMLLPKEREQSMAEAEAKYARENRRDFNSVRSTQFDFRLRGDSFEPVVLKME